MASQDQDGKVNMIPTEILDQITIYAIDHQIDKSGCETLKTLRLVNKAFCQVASRLLFRSVRACIRYDNQTPNQISAGLANLSASDNRHFVFDLCLYHYDSYTHLLPSPESILIQVLQNPPRVLKHFPSLRRVHIMVRSAGQGTLEAIGNLVPDDDVPEGVPFLPFFSVDALIMRKHISSSPLLGLNRSILFYVTPMLRHFHLEFRCMAEKPCIPQALWALRHAVHLESAVLESLGRIMDPIPVNHKPLGLVHPRAPLRSLYIYDTILPLSALLTIIECRETLEVVLFSHVRLSHGRWEVLLREFLVGFPRLRCISLRLCGYVSGIEAQFGFARQITRQYSITGADFRVYRQCVEQLEQNGESSSAVLESKNNAYTVNSTSRLGYRWLGSEAP
ncbi:hypothetical protein P175DRAFT_0490794 [Aspergillus ochraceoroseus IBT 24754]|uniref:F-box domain-containing protein n=1 Tax=Aspergillus ochraceoroseus IBT 24754 TaxID=1392256 RepID=A0A2T5M1B0_9EURO|nr:uncharacterized protein P175DRAFT_0490794 [Aspergillus ochraceoroseus IBT 24754]PTU22322.1 hypothetical protein P175DRAFT_0490794 [Aspergillus ochraceoroseus IBT 24754]